MGCRNRACQTDPMIKAAWKHVGTIEIHLAPSLLVTPFLCALPPSSPYSLPRNLCDSPDGMCAIPEYTTVNDRNQEGSLLLTRRCCFTEVDARRNTMTDNLSMLADSTALAD